MEDAERTESRSYPEIPGLRSVPEPAVDIIGRAEGPLQISASAY
jgi:hypothetical protein